MTDYFFCPRSLRWLQKGCMVATREAFPDNPLGYFEVTWYASVDEVGQGAILSLVNRGTHDLFPSYVFKDV